MTQIFKINQIRLLRQTDKEMQKEKMCLSNSLPYLINRGREIQKVRKEYYGCSKRFKPNR